MPRRHRMRTQWPLRSDGLFCRSRPGVCPTLPHTLTPPPIPYIKNTLRHPIRHTPIPPHILTHPCRISPQVHAPHVTLALVFSSLTRVFLGSFFRPPPPPPWQLILIVLVPVALALVLPNLAPKTSNVGGVPSCGGYGLYLPYECAASGLLVIITTMLCAFIVVFFTLLMSPLPCASALGECGQ